jgi:ABC-type molybdenum transport system ATPase subunit/photorepair protein PhrA
LEDGSISASFINTLDQLADIFTKSLGQVKFQELRANIGMVQISQARRARIKGRIVRVILA